MEENPHRASVADDTDGCSRRRPVAWYILATVAAVTGLFTVCCLFTLLLVIVLAIFSDTSAWEMRPYAICIIGFIGTVPWLAIWLVCIAAMRRIGR